MKRLLLLLAILSSMAFGQGGTTSSDIYPATTGQNIGNPSKRWNLYTQNINITGTFNCTGTGCPSGTGVTPSPPDLSIQLYNASTSGLTSDPNVTINTTTHKLTAPLFDTSSPNTWSQAQTFSSGISGTGSLGAFTLGSGALGTANAWTQPQTIGNAIFGGRPWFDMSNATYGAKCDGITDDTAAFNAAILAAYNANGGTIFVPGICVIAGQVTLPNDGGSPKPLQPNIRITGMGSSANGYWGTLPTSPSALDLQFNAGTAKIITLGGGVLEIDNLTLKDTNTDCASFILTTNTTLRIHGVTFSGTHSGTAACNDAITLGGAASAIIGSTTAAPFQGYGSVIQNNFFDKMQRLVYFRVFANNVTVRDNTNSTSCGSALADGAPYEFDSTGATTNQNVGNVLEGNLAEDTNYFHLIKCLSCSKNQFIANGSWDENLGRFLSTYYMNNANGFNYIVAGMNTDSLPALSGADTGTAGTTTFVTSHQGVQDFYASTGAHTFINNGSVGVQTVEASSSSRLDWDTKNTATNDEWFQRFIIGGTPVQQFFLKPIGGTEENMVSFKYLGLNQYSIQILGSSFSGIETPNGDFKLRVKTGNTVFFGDLSGQGMTWQQSTTTLKVATVNATTAYTVNTMPTIYFVTADFTTAANTSLQAIANLSWTFLANAALNVPVHCELQYSQATANVAVAFGVQDATVAPTNAQFSANMSTSTTAATTGTLSALASTSATNIVSATPSATATVFRVTLEGFIEQPSNASTSVFSVMVSTATSGDAVTIKRGSFCRIF